MRRPLISWFVWISVIFYYLVFAYLVFSTDFLRAVAASQLWKCMVIMSGPAWLIFLCIWMRWRTRPFGSDEHSSNISLVFVLVALLSFAAGFAPQFAYHAFGQTYSILYFDLIRFPFPSAIVALVSATSGIVSFNIGIARRQGRFTPRVSRSAVQRWCLVGQNALLSVGLVLTLNTYSAALTNT